MDFKQTQLMYENLAKKMAKSILKFNAVKEVGFKKLADFGWYIDGDIPLGYVTNLIEYAVEEKKKQLDDFFIEHYNNRIKESTKCFMSKHSNRLHIIKEAIECHNEKKFYSSTILFLSQADGICNGLLFKVGRNKQDLNKYLKSTEYGDFLTLILNSINEKSAIDSYYPEESNIYESALNRHGVIHGGITDFGTKENSLKAFSLLCFVNDFIDRHKE